MNRNPKEKSRQEYIARINRVMDYIDRHLDRHLELSTIAGIASFSPFHFHRIFTYLVGETPLDYVQRLRTEKAASLLRDPAMTVAQAAYDCGFSTVSLFSRTFRKYFGTTPTEFRQSEPAVFSQGGVFYSKNGQPLSRNVKMFHRLDPDLCRVKPNELMFMETKIEVRLMPDFHVIYCRHTGDFSRIGEAYRKVCRWAAPRGLYEEGKTRMLTVTHDDPAVTETGKVRQSACILLDDRIDDVAIEGETGKMVVPGGRYAVGRFEVGVDEFARAWNTMCHWFTESGYQQGDGWTYELYPCEEPADPDKQVVDICIPVKPL